MDIDELLRLAAAREADGDLEGAISTYQSADVQGSAEAAVLMGQLYRRTGRMELARAAFGRGEQRGHSEAAGCLGNMLCDAADFAGARAAYERGIAAGSQIAVLNLGLMLADAGEDQDALTYLRTASGNGDPEAFWVIGRLLERRGDTAGAREAYENGAQGGHAAAAYDLGVLRSRAEDHSGARKAFELARTLGHQGAAELLAAFEDAEQAPTASVDLSALWAEVQTLFPALAAERQRVGRAWIADQMTVQERQATATALGQIHAERREQIGRLEAAFPELPRRRTTTVTGRTASPQRWLAAGSRTLSPELAREFDTEVQSARSSLQEARGRRFGSSHKQAGVEAHARFAARLDELRAAHEQARSDVVAAESTRDANALAARRSSEDALQSSRRAAASAAALLPALLQPWSDDAWRTWTPTEAPAGLTACFGGGLSPLPDPRLGPSASLGIECEVPWAMAMRQNWSVQFGESERSSAHGLVRNLMVRHLAGHPPGALRFCIYDPIGLGRSAGDLLNLAEHNSELIDGKVWTTQNDLERRLDELTDHVELVVQKYLRTTYDTIDDFNAAAGEVAEPYRMLVLFDFPVGVTARAAERLQSITENGPRCGVYTVIAGGPQETIAPGIDLGRLTSAMRTLDLRSGIAEEFNGHRLAMTLRPEELPTRSGVAARVIDAVGRAAADRGEAAVTFAKGLSLYAASAARGRRPEFGQAAATTVVDDPSTWWRDDSTRGLYAPIGQKGARDVAVLGFDSEDHAGALLVGRPGSGKSTLLHTYVAGLTTLYGPEELELHLIDFKEGVEFKAYAEHALPHARTIAVESDREFGVSVLESIQAEISDRAQALRSTGGRQAGLRSFRQATGEVVPRVLLVFDEFQVLFARADAVGTKAAELLESIIRQGRGFGIHVLLGSQSLSGLDALGAHVPQLLPVRVLLPAAETDARKVLGDTNAAGDVLTSHGEGILNSAGGAVAANERFRGAKLDEADRVGRLQTLRLKADSTGFTRRPVVFEGSKLIRLSAESPESFREHLTVTGPRPLRLRSGVAMTVGDTADVMLTREAGSNVLAVLRAGDEADVDPSSSPPYGLLVAAAASAALSPAAIDVVDFMPIDDGLDELLEPLLNHGRLTLRRKRAFADVLERYDREVSDRSGKDDTTRAAWVLFLFGVHRARELDAEIGSLDVDADVADRLERIMRDGPEVGVHVWLWSDTVSGAARRLSARMMRETAWRIAGRMSVDDAHALLGNGLAAELRPSQLLLAHEDRGSTARVTAYSAPSPEWLDEMVGLGAAHRDPEGD